MSLPTATPDSTVIVTGASSGIGAELVRELSRRGHHTTLVARREEAMTALADEVGADLAAVRPCDLSDDSQRLAFVDEMLAGNRTVVGLCNNAGFGTSGRFHKLDQARELEEVRLNILALHHLVAAFLPGMVDRAEGAILNVASIAGAQPVPGMATYSATKAFVISFSEAVHVELQGTGVSCTVISPGPTRTAWADTAGADWMERVMPRRFWSTPTDVARAGVEAMVNGRRTVTPGLHNRLAATGGRMSPRTFLLPAARRATSFGRRRSS